MEKDPMKAINARVQKISEDEVINRGMVLQGRLAAICSGFFEIHRRPVTEEVTRAPDSRQAWLKLAKHTRRMNHEPELLRVGGFESWQRAEVEFLHRTAADFLGQGHIEKYLTKITSKENFDPVKSLLRSCVFRVKAFPCEYVTSLPLGEMGEVILEAFLYALDNEKQTGRVQATLLNELDKSLAQHRQRLTHWDVMHDKNAAHCRRAEAHATFEHYEPFIGMAARYGLHKYFNFKLSRQGLSECESDARPLLFSVLRVRRHENKNSSVPITEQPPSLQLVKLLNDSGADPNAPWHGLTAWTDACINYFEMSMAYGEGFDMNQYTDGMAALIIAGADPNVLIEKLGIKSRPFGGVVMSPISSIKLPRGTFVREAEGPRELGNRLNELLERRGGQEHHIWLMPEKSFWSDHFQKKRHMQNFEGLNSVWAEWRMFSDAKRQKTTFKNVRTIWYRKDEIPCAISSDWDFGVCDTAAPQTLWEGIFVP
jgi:hypothetical protein